MSGYASCGGCQGLGAHSKYCSKNPIWHPWTQLADRAESIGDSIGVPELANQAWALAAAIRKEQVNHPAPRVSKAEVIAYGRAISQSKE